MILKNKGFAGFESLFFEFYANLVLRAYNFWVGLWQSSVIII